MEKGRERKVKKVIKENPIKENPIKEIKAKEKNHPIKIRVTLLPIITILDLLCPHRV